MSIYKLVYDDFCGWLLEIIKPDYQQPIDRKTYDELISLFEDNLRILHPFTPFATEELWHRLRERDEKDSLCINQWPEACSIDNQLLEDFAIIQDVISGVRKVRKEKQIAFKNAIELKVLDDSKANADHDGLIARMGNISYHRKSDRAHGRSCKL